MLSVLQHTAFIP